MSAELKAEGVDLQLMELRTAALQRACTLLTELEAMVKRIGGFSSYDDQATLHESREFLASMGYRLNPNPPQTWTDRIVATAPRPRRPIAIRGVDVPCESCGALQGSTLDNGWHRCNACGYPGK